MSTNLEDKPLSPFADRDAVLGYLALRICLGVNIAMHGVARLLAGPSVFIEAITKQFAHTPLPPWSVQAFGFSLPWIESVIGLMILGGIATRYVLLCGGLLIAVLTFGSTLTQQWEIAGTQLIYAVAFSLLLVWRRHNLISIDGLVAKRAESRNERLP
jgi:thiosulfate dehydrogenase [quinone] large subunit